MNGNEIVSVVDLLLIMIEIVNIVLKLVISNGLGTSGALLEREERLGMASAWEDWN